MFGPTNFIETTTTATATTARMKIFWMKISRRFLEDSRLFIYFLLLISDEDFYGGRTGPLEKFYLFIYFL